MDNEDVRAFLTLYRSHNFTKAAQEVGMTQSALSQRIQRMEDEFNTALVIRSKGRKNVEFTPGGQRLYAISQQWEELYQNARSHLAAKEYLPVVISATNSINTYLFSPFLKSYIDENHPVTLTCIVNHSWEIFNQLADGSIDIGLSNRPASSLYKDIKATEFYRERYLLISWKNLDPLLHNGAIRPQELDVSEEVFVDIDPQFTQWHESIWGNRASLVILNCSDSVPSILEGSCRWAILPYSIASFLAAQYQLNTYELIEQPPYRICYVAYHKRLHSYKENVLMAFLKELHDYFKDKNKV